MDQHIERILRQIPGWNISEAVVSPLVGGITNQNYRVDIGGESFVLRIGGQGTHLLGIDRQRESICTAIAAQVGVGAEVLHFLAAEDVLITRFITGTSISPETAAQPETLRRIIDSMRRYHAGPAFPGSFSPFETVRNYHKLALKHGVKFPDTLTTVFVLMAQIEAALAEAGMDQVKSCHNDLLASNFIDDGRNIWIVDWEYAGMGDIFFDLGNFAVNQSLNDEQCQLLLQYYFGELRPADLAHLHLLRLGSDLRESFWGFLQLGISELDFDYREYAHHHLNRFLHNIETSPFEQWLRDVRL
ncbi:MAG TPA: choline/ethanolamine kinase family protein [Ktedonobacteraceae bacterium]|nr:choline/ethanolamine kinase family protein [Ktedonobacteraceae bacterium]